ncbi:MAG: CoA-binding protein [Kiritimatiellia bacterium]
MNAAVLGASNKRERYSYQAVKLLAEKSHAVFPVHPAISEIDGIPVFKRLADISVPIHTITVYLAPERSAALADEILAARSKRVIFNPGAENPELARLDAAFIKESLILREPGKQKCPNWRNG